MAAIAAQLSSTAGQLGSAGSEGPVTFGTGLGEGVGEGEALGAVEGEGVGEGDTLGDGSGTATRETCRGKSVGEVVD